jgi:hypothetical protein
MSAENGKALDGHQPAHVRRAISQPLSKLYRRDKLFLSKYHAIAISVDHFKLLYPSY